MLYIGKNPAKKGGGLIFQSAKTGLWDKDMSRAPFFKGTNWISCNQRIIPKPALVKSEGSRLGTTFVERIIFSDPGNLFKKTSLSRQSEKENEKMIMDRIALILVIIGGINWGSVGLFRFDIVAWLFGGQTATVSRVVYTLVGLSAVWCVSLLFRENEEGRETA